MLAPRNTPPMTRYFKLPSALPHLADVARRLKRSALLPVGVSSKFSVLSSSQIAATLIVGVVAWQWSGSRVFDRTIDTRTVQVVEAGVSGMWASTDDNPSQASVPQDLTGTEIALLAIETYSGTAAREAQRFGIDEAALLATAVWESEMRADGRIDVKTAFPVALAQTPIIEADAFRAMSLEVLYAVGDRLPRTQEDWISAIASQYPDASQAEAAHRPDRRHDRKSSDHGQPTSRPPTRSADQRPSIRQR